MFSIFGNLYIDDFTIMIIVSKLLYEHVMELIQDILNSKIKTYSQKMINNLLKLSKIFKKTFSTKIMV